MCVTLTPDTLEVLATSFILKVPRVCPGFAPNRLHFLEPDKRPARGRSAQLQAARVFSLPRFCKQFYNVALSPQVQVKLPTMYSAVTTRLTLSPSTIVAKALTTRGGTDFTLLTKNANWIGDIYSGFIAPYYKADVYTETWLNGTAKLSSSRGLHFLRNVVVSAVACVGVVPGLPGTDRGNYCRPKYQYNTMNIMSFNAAGYTMQNKLVRHTIALFERRRFWVRWREHNTSVPCLHRHTPRITQRMPSCRPWACSVLET